MKKTLAWLLIILFNMATAQITLDTTFQNASSRLSMVNLELSGPKYLLKSTAQGNRFLKFYSLDHSLWKTIDCNPFPTSTYTMMVPPIPPSTVIVVNTVGVFNFGSLYISQTLFDCDTNIEFMYTNATPLKMFTGIYNETGAAVMLADSMSPVVKPGVPQQFRPIYNTPNGTKMILSHNNGSAHVYSLPCTLSPGTDMRMAAQEAEENLITGPVEPRMSFYPNRIRYTLPEGAASAYIVISDADGGEVKRYLVDDAFSNLLIGQNDVKPGKYTYSLCINGKVLESKPVVFQLPDQSR